MNFTQKEKSLLEDQKKHEQLCIEKYQKYASQAQDPQLKQLFSSFAQAEQQHLNTINQILSGQVPSMSQGQQGASQGQSQGAAQNSTASQSQGSALQSSAGTQGQATTQGATVNQNDAGLCNDMLMTEKYVSGAYDTAIFEFTNADVRQVLNHIQKEEQQHGEGLFNYMQSNGMYNVQA